MYVNRTDKRGIKATAYSKNLLKLLRLEVNEAGFDFLDRVKLIRTGFLQLGGYLLDLCGGDAFEVSFLTVTEKLKLSGKIQVRSGWDPTWRTVDP